MYLQKYEVIGRGHPPPLVGQRQGARGQWGRGGWSQYGGWGEREESTLLFAWSAGCEPRVGGALEPGKGQ